MSMIEASGAANVGTDAFRYVDLPTFGRFSDVLDATVYAPIPDDWVIGHCDVVDSTAAVAQGRYRAVNVAGAAVITSVRNALHGAAFPFVFGGDGASLVVSPRDRQAVAAALADTVTWVREDLGLTLRATLIPVSEVRSAGLDVRVARYAASSDAIYAMFSGGGLAWADKVTKQGRYAVAAAPDGARPDLTGLSCRFEATAPTDGVVLSLIVVPSEGADPSAVRTAFGDVLAIVEASPAMGRPLLETGPPMRWPPSGLAIEAHARGRRGPGKAWLYLRTLVSFLAFRTGATVGGFSPRAYTRQLVANADFRKYDDGLRMTVACAHRTADAIEERLSGARDAGLLSYGLHRQVSAVVTCISPSPARRDHIHFVDGIDGGYAQAALQLKCGACESRSNSPLSAK